MAKNWVFIWELGFMEHRDDVLDARLVQIMHQFLLQCTNVFRNERETTNKHLKSPFLNTQRDANFYVQQ